MAKRRTSRSPSIRTSLPDWANPDMRLLKSLTDKASGPPPQDWLDCLADEDVERALFGFSSLQDVIELNVDEISWNYSRQGTPEEIEAEIEDHGAEYYDTSIPLIVDLLRDGSFELNDGHHRFFILTQYEGQNTVDTYVQVPPGLAKDWARELLRSRNVTPNAARPIDHEQMRKGIKHEMEHTDDPVVSAATACDHLREIPDYYDRLAKLEAEAKRAGVMENPFPTWNREADKVSGVGAGIGNTSYNLDIDYFGIRVMMKPTVFHALAHELKREDAPSVEGIKRQMRSIERTGLTEPYRPFDDDDYEVKPTKGFASPTLYVDIPDGWLKDDMREDAEVSGHEGRNRMYAAKELYGDEPVEVHIIPRGHRRRHVKPEWVARMNEGMLSERSRRGAPHFVRGPLFTSVLTELEPNGDVVGFPQAPPRVDILGRSYALSTMGPVVRVEPGEMPDEGDEDDGRGARVITGGGDPWRYIWFLNKDTGEIHLHRWSDGAENFATDASEFPGTVASLKASRQLNVVDDRTFGEIMEFMLAKYHEKAEALAQWAEELESDQQKVVNQLVLQFMNEQVLPEARRMWSEIDRGVYPFDFEFNENIPKPRSQQAKMHAFLAAASRVGFEPYDSALERFVLQLLGFSDVTEMDDIQALHWAFHDALYKGYSMVPTR